MTTTRDPQPELLLDPERLRSGLPAAAQLWDVKGSGDPTIMDPQNLAHYGALCACALARAQSVASACDGAPTPHR
jgi:hypothetical protein